MSNKGAVVIGQRTISIKFGKTQRKSLTDCDIAQSQEFSTRFKSKAPNIDVSGIVKEGEP